MSGPAGGGPAAIPTGADFVRAAVKRDVDAGRYGGRVRTRFPPEPSGYLHIGHVKAICVNFGIAAEFGGTCALRYDDTNPEREETRYVEQIKTDIRWLGFDWGPREFYASDYFERLYQLAVQLIEAGKAYVDDLSAEEIVACRGVAQAAGRDSPYRTRSVAENLDLFRRMRAGEFEEGACVLRAKIDMAAPNVYLRDPVMYRILRTAHHRTGGRWRIYPTYDWAHGQSDSIEGVTHSLCTLEYEPHRPLYDWFIAALGIFPSRQIEYNHLYVSHTMTGKRRLKEMVEAGDVTGWDDPRLPTIAALRRRGVPPAALRRFATAVGLSKTHVLVQIELFEHLLREHLNRTARRVMAVLDPIRLTITNYPAGQVELVDCRNNPEDRSAGTRQVPFSGELYVERDDFRDDPPRKWFRLAVGREVRLKHACYVTCDEVVRDAQGRPIELRCTYDPASRGGGTADGRKVRGTLHWVSAAHALDAEVRLYDRLFTKADMNDLAEGEDWRDYLNPDALRVLTGCKLEPGLADAEPSVPMQFIRTGYFCLDARDAAPGRPVFNRTIGLRDTWSRIERARIERAQGGTDGTI